jgi:hypothetical protein
MASSSVGRSRKLHIGAFGFYLRCHMPGVEVLKFGSSVLRSPRDLYVAVDEIYRRWRSGCRILAVVFAFVLISAGKWTRTFAGENRDFLVSTVSMRKVEKWTGQAA